MRAENRERPTLSLADLSEKVTALSQLTAVSMFSINLLPPGVHRASPIRAELRPVVSRRDYLTFALLGETLARQSW